MKDTSNGPYRGRCHHVARAQLSRENAERLSLAVLVFSIVVCSRGIGSTAGGKLQLPELHEVVNLQCTHPSGHHRLRGM